MLTEEENNLLTRTGHGTPCGDLLRRYWQPVALSEELPEGGAPLSVEVLGEALVLFRDGDGRPGLLGLHCAHRGADLSLGRVENGGLRCIYHGWLYDVQGRCLEQPGEPAGSDFKDKIRHRAYPCTEKAGIVFGYLGAGEPPLVPAYEALVAAPEHRYVTKTFHDCNHLQANEGNLDPAHLSFLHRRLTDPYHRSVKGTDGTLPIALFIGDVAPTIQVEETDFGLRIITLRKAGEDKMYLRVTYFVLPNLSCIAGPTAGDGYDIHWHVPINDHCHWRYDVIFSTSAPLSAHDWKKINMERNEKNGGYQWIRNRGNHWLQDRESMKSWNFSGLGGFNNAQDTAVVESAGPVQDRTEEHLGTTDKAIIAARHLILKAIQEVEAGREPPHVIRDPRANRFPHMAVIAEVIPASEDWRGYWKKATREGPAESKAAL